MARKNVNSFTDAVEVLFDAVYSKAVDVKDALAELMSSSVPGLKSLILKLVSKQYYAEEKKKYDLVERARQALQEVVLFALAQKDLSALHEFFKRILEKLAQELAEIAKQIVALTAQIATAKAALVNVEQQVTLARQTYVTQAREALKTISGTANQHVVDKVQGTFARFEKGDESLAQHEKELKDSSVHSLYERLLPSTAGVSRLENSRLDLIAMIQGLTDSLRGRQERQIAVLAVQKRADHCVNHLGGVIGEDMGAMCDYIASFKKKSQISSNGYSLHSDSKNRVTYTPSDSVDAVKILTNRNSK